MADHSKAFVRNYTILKKAAQSVMGGKRDYNVAEVAGAIAGMRFHRDVIKKEMGVD